MYALEVIVRLNAQAAERELAVREGREPAVGRVGPTVELHTVRPVPATPAREIR